MNPRFQRDTYKLKHLHSLNVQRTVPYSSQDLRYKQKLAKRFQRSLRYISDGLKHPKVQKLLPLLAEYEVTPAHHKSWRVLITRSAFKKLTFRFDHYQDGPETNASHFSMTYKSALSRHLQKLKTLKEICLRVNHSDVKLTIFLLKLFGKTAFLNPLKNFSFNVNPSIQPTSLQDLTAKAIEMNKALAYITKVQLCSEDWSSGFLSIGKFDNLVDLRLNISLESKPLDLSYLQKLQNLKKVKNFLFNFRVESLVNEKEFLRNFTLPPSMEDFQLFLENFALSEVGLQRTNWEKVHDKLITDQLYLDFYEKFQNYPNVKSLSLKFNGNPPVTKNCPEIFGTFAGLIIQKFTKLEKLSYIHWSSSKKTKTTMILPLDFEPFWSRLTPSKDTLQAISVDCSEILFPNPTSKLEIEFPRLNFLRLEAKIFEPTMFGSFACKLPRLSRIIAKELVFYEARRLKGFFDGIKEIPIEIKAAWDLNVDGIKQEILIDCLKGFLEKEDIKGELDWGFKDVMIIKAEDFKEILKLASDRKCINLLRLTNKSHDKALSSNDR